MPTTRPKQIYVYLIALLSAALNGYYSYEYLRAFLDPATPAPVRQILIAVITLNLSWLALTLWMLLDLPHRRAIFLFAMASSLGANLLTGFTTLTSNPGDWTPVLTNLAIGLVIAALYILAYLLAKPPDTPPA